jgi:uncharacterized protein
MAKSILHKWQEILSIHKWVGYILPFVVFMLFTSFEPKDPESPNYIYYPWIYGLKLLATIFALRIVWPVYKPMIKPVGVQGVLFGVIGVVLWVGICNLELEQKYFFPLVEMLHLDTLIGSGTRSAFNPFEAWKGSLVVITAYLIVRGIGLTIIVPIIEEHFLRGFMMRYIAAEKWWKYPIGNVTRQSAIFGTLIPMLMHPSELLAAAVWFSLITMLYVRTKNLWECIVAHGVTNFLLGAYVVATNSWHLV